MSYIKQALSAAFSSNLMTPCHMLLSRSAAGRAYKKGPVDTARPWPGPSWQHCIQQVRRSVGRVGSAARHLPQTARVTEPGQMGNVGMDSWWVERKSWWKERKIWIARLGAAKICRGAGLQVLMAQRSDPRCPSCPRCPSSWHPRWHRDLTHAAPAHGTEI